MTQWSNCKGLVLSLLLALALAQCPAVLVADSAQDFRSGQELMAHKHYLEAIPLFQSIMASFPEYAARAQLKVAECYRCLDRFTEAIAQYTAALSLATSRSEQQTSVEIRTGLAHAYYSAGMYDDALRLCQGAESLKAEQSDYIQARCYLMQKQFDRAIPVYDRMLLSYPNSDKAAQYSIDRLECLAWLHRFEQLCTDLKTLLVNYPNATITSKKSSDALSSTLEQVGLKANQEDAVCVADALYARITAEANLRPRLRSAMACVLSKAKRIDAAADLLKAGAAGSQSAEEKAGWYRQAAVLLLNANRHTEAIACAEAGLGFQAQSAEPALKYIIALSRIKTAEYRTAVELLTEITTRFADTPTAKAATEQLILLRKTAPEAFETEVSK